MLNAESALPAISPGRAYRNECETMIRSDKVKLSPSQLMSLICGFILGSVLLLSFEDNALEQDSWLGIIAAFIASTPFVLAIAILAKKFPGKNLVDILSVIYGRFLGKALFLLYIGVFFLILSFNMRDLADFYIGFIMPEMPMPVLLIVTMLIGGYAVHKGIQLRLIRTTRSRRAMRPTIVVASVSMSTRSDQTSQLWTPTQRIGMPDMTCWYRPRSKT